MAQLNSALSKNGVVLDHSDDTIFDENELYLYGVGVPEKAYDNKKNYMFYKVTSSDIAPSCTFPFALDNQWMPTVFYDKNSKYYNAFTQEGFSSKIVEDYMMKYQEDNFMLALINSRQIILNRASLLSNIFFKRVLTEETYKSSKEALKKMLENGSIIVFLYEDNAITPYVHELPKHGGRSEVIRSWNTICTEIGIYCIRVNWKTASDHHSIELAKYATTFAVDSEVNSMIGKTFNLNPQQLIKFNETLKSIEMQVFCQTHMNGTNKSDKVDGYSRTTFYKNFIVKPSNPGELNSVLYCIFDETKPFHRELKKMVDIFYNSIFSNCFRCAALFPYDIHPNDAYLQQLYLKHGEREVSVEELEYAFSDIFESDIVLEEMKRIGKNIYLDNWKIEKVMKLRSTDKWKEYAWMLESVSKRNFIWKVDFSELEVLAKKFADCFNNDNVDILTDDELCYSFRISIGSKTMDVVKNKKLGKIKEYGGEFSTSKQNSLIIQFSFGDLSLEKNKINVFSSIVLFVGKTDDCFGADYFNSLKNFFIKQCNFFNID